MLFKRIKGASFYENIFEYYSAAFNYRINNLGYKKIRSRSLKAKQKTYETLVTDAVKTALKGVKLSGFDGTNDPFGPLKIVPVSRVWGLNVVVFGFSFYFIELDKKQVRQVKKEISYQLSLYAKQKGLVTVNDKSPLVISDIWFREGKLNIEIAYLVNQQTIGYVNDIEKLEK
jgi:hypothetical protein